MVQYGLFKDQYCLEKKTVREDKLERNHFTDTIKHNYISINKKPFQFRIYTNYFCQCFLYRCFSYEV